MSEADMRHDGDASGEWDWQIYQVDQQRITALDSTTFIVKGWALTLVSALTGFATSSDAPGLVAIALLPIVGFAFLDLRYRRAQLCHTDRADDIEQRVAAELALKARCPGRTRFRTVACFYAVMLGFDVAVLGVLLLT